MWSDLRNDSHRAVVLKRKRDEAEGSAGGGGGETGRLSGPAFLAAGTTRPSNKTAHLKCPFGCNGHVL
jgi:hypothetical protein